MPRPPRPLPDDVTLFRAPPTRRARLGRVTATDATSITVDSLARVEPRTHVVADGEPLSVPATAVVAVVSDWLDYGSRIQPDRVANPHAEHAEECWTAVGRGRR